MVNRWLGFITIVAATRFTPQHNWLNAANKRVHPTSSIRILFQSVQMLPKIPIILWICRYSLPLSRMRISSFHLITVHWTIFGMDMRSVRPIDFYRFYSVSWLILKGIFVFAVIGDHMNRRVAIHSIHDGNMGTLADFRRADIFQRNETLNTLIKISNCKYLNVDASISGLEWFPPFSFQLEKWNCSPSTTTPNSNCWPPQKIQNIRERLWVIWALHPTTTPKSISSTIATIRQRSSIRKWLQNMLRSDTRCCWMIRISMHRSIRGIVRELPCSFTSSNFIFSFRYVTGLTSRCKTYTATKYEYRDFFPLNTIRESQPSGYQVRLAFYAQATRNAHVLLSRSATPNLAVDNVYEFSECKMSKSRGACCSLLSLQLLEDGWTLGCSSDARKAIKCCNKFLSSQFCRCRFQRNSSSKWPIVSEMGSHVSGQCSTTFLFRCRRIHSNICREWSTGANSQCVRSGYSASEIR